MGGKGGYFQKLSQGSETSDMTSEGLGEMMSTLLMGAEQRVNEYGQIGP